MNLLKISYPITCLYSADVKFLLVHIHTVIIVSVCARIFVHTSVPTLCVLDALAFNHLSVILFVSAVCHVAMCMALPVVFHSWWIVVLFPSWIQFTLCSKPPRSVNKSVYLMPKVPWATAGAQPGKTANPTTMTTEGRGGGGCLS